MCGGFSGVGICAWDPFFALIRCGPRFSGRWVKVGIVRCGRNWVGCLRRVWTAWLKPRRLELGEPAITVGFGLCRIMTDIDRAIRHALCGSFCAFLRLELLFGRDREPKADVLVSSRVVCRLCTALGNEAGTLRLSLNLHLLRPHHCPTISPRPPIALICLFFGAREAVSGSVRLL